VTATVGARLVNELKDEILELQGQIGQHRD